MTVPKFLHIIFSFVFILSVFLHIPKVYSQTPTDVPNAENKANDLKNQISDYQSKITSLQGETKTLSSQIKVADTQIKLTELKIRSNQEEIDELSKDIETVSIKVENLEGSLERITNALLNRTKGVYRSGSIEPYQLLLSSNSITDAFTKLKYLKIVQKSDQKLILHTVQSKANYENEKSLFEKKKQKIVSLKEQLDKNVKELDQQKQEKQNLLTITKNSESEYQKKLSLALRELQQIQKAAVVLVNTEPKDVKRGDAIGLMGSSGFSTGSHLHFGIYNYSSLEQYSYYGSHENPINNIQNQTVKWDTGCGEDPQGDSATGTGSFAWPMNTSGLKITQGYGNTCWSWMYKGNPHPALDIVGTGDITVKAIDDGKAYACRNCTGDGANGVFLFHSNGKMSLYWHLQ